MRFIHRRTIYTLVMTGLALASCKPRENIRTASSEPPQQVFTVQGILRGIDFAGRAVTVEHEEIPDYMPAMTMPFDVKSMAEVEPLKVGDAVEFKMVVTDKSSWIENVKKIAPGEVQLPAIASAKTAVPGTSAARLKEGDRLPAFQLVDDQGRPVTRETYAGKPLLLTFIFTRCPIPNFCPLMSNNFRDIHTAIAGDAALSGEVQFLSISFDSEFDTPEVLARYAERYTEDHETWRFATGTKEQTEKLTAAFSIHVQPEAGTLSHGLCTALIGPDGVIRKLWRGNSWQPSEVVAALRELKGGLAHTAR